MARSDIKTLIPLDRAARLFGIDPLHFNSVYSTISPIDNAADDTWFQFAYQSSGRVSREELASSLQRAEEKTAQLLGYWPLPVWIEEEKSITQPYKPEMYGRLGLNTRGQAKSVTASWGYIQAIGTKAKTIIEVGATVTYTDENSDGYSETATVTVATDVADENEIVVYFPSKSGKEEWQIRPIEVSISSGTATITFKRELAVEPDLWEVTPTFNDRDVTINGDDDDNFISTVDVYRVYTDDTDHAVFYTEPNRNRTEYYTETGKLWVRGEKKRGMLAYQRADYTDGSWVPTYFTKGREPDKILIKYKAGVVDTGLDRPHHNMSRYWERLICFYALTELDKEPKGSGNFRTIYEYMSFDYRVAPNGNIYVVNEAEIANPLGTTRAAINLWKAIRHRRNLRGY